MTHPLTGIIDDLRAVRDEALAGLNLLPNPELPDEDRPPHWFRHLYDAEGRLKP